MNTTYEPNLFDLGGHGFTIKYSATSIAGVPLLSVEHGKTQRSFRGDEIRTQETELARLVTVTLESAPDLKSVTLTVAIPAMNLDGREGPIETFAVVTTSRTSIGGPRLVKGQIQTYETVMLKGKAQSVDF